MKRELVLDRSRIVDLFDIQCSGLYSRCGGLVMRISMKVDYGVRALVELAQHGLTTPLQAATIATRQGIPEAYLDQVLTTLNKAGVISSRRGPQGGHLLAMDPQVIDLGWIMNVLERKTPLLDCLVEPDGCTLSDACAQREVWASFEDAVQDLLRNTSIADMVQRQRQLVETRSTG